MRAKDIMTTPVVSTGPDASLKDVAALLIEHSISAVPVVDEHDELVGIVSEADLVELERTADPRSRILPIPHRSGPLPESISEVMSSPVTTVTEDVDTSEIVRLMLEEHLKLIPVVSGRRVVGVVARRDILRMLARSDGEIRAEIEELLDDDLLMLRHFDVEVEGGVATLRGSADATGRRLAEILARSVPGVVDVFVDEVNP